MPDPSREFQVFLKPAGPRCNLACRYCYYVSKEDLHAKGEPARMADEVLERCIVQHIAACSDPVIRFSWHGGEPTILGLDYFRHVVALQRKHCPAGRSIANGIQTNGTLLNDDWCRFLAAEGFTVGLSLDGPAWMHDRCRVTKDGRPTHERAIRGYRLLQEHGVPCEILCVVNACNAGHATEVYRFFKELGAGYLSFLPLVERDPQTPTGVSERTVPPEAWGAFLCTVFDEWRARDIGRVKVQIFEETVRPAFGQEHTLCVFRKTCGGVPVVEHNGDFFSCDHFVDAEHRLGNIQSTSLADLLDDPRQKAFGQAKFDTLPQYCRQCSVLVMCHGGCPKDRFLRTPDGEGGLNYLCAGYQRFFTHCQPFVAEVAALWRRTESDSRRVGLAPPASSTPQVSVGQAPPYRNARIGRNDPCPCGSGRKYKNCCMTR
jgi:uncharacterized protein